MKKSMKNSLTWLVATIALAGCSSFSQPSARFMDNDGFTVRVASDSKARNPEIAKLIWQDQFRNVLLVAKEKSAPNNQHPARYTKEQVRAMLSSVQARYKDNEATPLFEAEDLEDLIPPLADALNSAAPEQYSQLQQI